MARKGKSNNRHRGFYWLLGAVVVVGLGVIAAQIRKSPRQPESQQVSSLVASSADLEKASQMGVVVGQDDAPVTVVEFMDYLCPYCGRATLNLFPLVDSLYIQQGKVRWIFVDFPLPSHRTSFIAAVLTRCAYQEGGWDLYEKLHRMYFARMQEWGRLPNPTDLLIQWAREAGADPKAMRACFESGTMHDLVEKNRQYGRSLGVRATPTFFINGEKYEGMPRDPKEFLKVLDTKLGS